MAEEQKPQTIVPVDIEAEMKKSYLDYAMSVIVARAIPDVRDGLKPVQRRILVAMNDLGLASNRGYRKCAKICGDTSGNYHPHGEAVIYPALVRLAQDFNLRYMLIDGQGNFGSVDGDPPAAMRYTEARLAKITEDILADLEKDTVDFTPNFDQTREEPVVLPSRIPNLLVNGASGIAVGMATNIPPHNLREIVDAAIVLIEKPDTTLKEITPKLEKIFAGWKSGEVPKKNVARVEMASKTEVYLIDRPGSGQSLIFGSLLAPPRNDPDAIPIQIVNNVFGGTFSSRINMNLREDKHWSYGTFAAIPAARGQRPYFSVAPVQTDKTKESLSEMVKEYHDIIGTRPIDEKELGREQANATLGLPGSFETVQQLAGAYSQIIQYGLPADYFNTFTQNVLALNPDSANAIAKKLIQPDHVVWVVVGDMSKVEAGIRELNLGDIHKIDADGNAVQ